jgi:hypothetical protein
MTEHNLRIKQKINPDLTSFITDYFFSSWMWMDQWKLEVMQQYWYGFSKPAL